MKCLTKFVSALASLLVFVAGIGISPNSLWFCYEPDIPQSLRNKE